MDDDESNFSYKTYLWGIVGFIVFALIYTPLVWLPIIKNRLQTGVGNSTLFWIVNCIGVIPFIAVYGLIKAMFKKWRKEKGSKWMGKADLLPMGSLVYLKGGDMKLMIIARGPIFEDK